MSELETARQLVENNVANSRYVWVNNKPDAGYIVCDSGYGRFVAQDTASRYFVYWFDEMLTYAERNGYDGVLVTPDDVVNVIFICPFNAFDSLVAAENAAKQRDEWGVYDFVLNETIPTRWF